MVDFLQIPVACRMNTQIPLERLGIQEEYVSAVTVLAIIKPGLSKAFYADTDINHIGEITVLEVKLNQIPEDFYGIVQRIFKNIKYRCLVILSYADKLKLSTCRFELGKNDSTLNVLKSINVSWWIHPDLMSEPVQKSIQQIRTALNANNDLDSIYRSIHSAVVDIKQSGTSMAHAHRIAINLVGSSRGLNLEEIYQYITPIHFHKPKDRRNRYSSEKETNYILLHDYEEIWYCLNKYEKTRRIIEAQDYKSMEEMLYYVEGDKWY